VLVDNGGAWWGPSNLIFVFSHGSVMSDALTLLTFPYLYVSEVGEKVEGLFGFSPTHREGKQVAIWV